MKVETLELCRHLLLREASRMQSTVEVAREALAKANDAEWNSKQEEREELRRERDLRAAALDAAIRHRDRVDSALTDFLGHNWR